MSHAREASTRAVPWTVLNLALLATRLPALVEPAGNDQSLYMYIADRVREGGVPYLDGWDQKPPGVHFLYAALRTVWPHQSIVALADLAGAALIAWFLVRLGRRLTGGYAGHVAAALFLLFGHPSIARLSGVYIRGQCEVFIAAAVAGALVVLARPMRRRWHTVGAGVLLAATFWLKYNALAYALPLLVVCTLWPTGGALTRRSVLADASRIGAGFTSVSAVVLAYFAWHHALTDLWLATITYNLGYSKETYVGRTGGPLAYMFTMPIAHASVEMIWFLGCAGAALLAATNLRRRMPAALVAASWLAAALVSIAVNGARELPQYFVQAWPALALCASLGFQAAWRNGRVWQAGVAVVLALGVWRVGVESPSVLGLRWGGVPQLVENLQFDVRYSQEHMARSTYLARFKGAQKYDAAAVDELAGYVRGTTKAGDRIFVFGFAPGVYVESGRAGSSRFFWSRPVIVEFAASHAGYGSQGLLQDLLTHPPALVALQKHDWAPDVADSMEFFMNHGALHDWLLAGYTLDRDTAVFSVWRRRS